MSHPSHDSPQRRYASWARAYFDAYGTAEWDRLEHSIAGKVNFTLHCDALRTYLQPGDHVLEAGAGPGRFTRELCGLDTRITVGDISPEQLRLNASYVDTNPEHAAHIEDRVILDICDLSQFANECFDATVCIGGPISYVFENADRALDELIRVTKRDGILICSVMSRYGAMRVYLPTLGEAMRQDPTRVNELNDIFRTGRIDAHDTNIHACQLYTWEQCAALFARHDCTIVHASASNFLTASDEFLTHGPQSKAYAQHRSGLSQHFSPQSLETLIDWERQVCTSPAILDGGTHIIVVARCPKDR